MLVAMGLGEEEGTCGLQRASFGPWLSPASGGVGHRKMVKYMSFSSTDPCPLCLYTGHINSCADGPGHGVAAGPKPIQPPPSWVSVGSSFPQWLLHQIIEAPALPLTSTLMVPCVLRWFVCSEVENTLEVSSTSVSTLHRAGAAFAMTATPGGSTLGYSTCV